MKNKLCLPIAAAAMLVGGCGQQASTPSATNSNQATPAAEADVKLVVPAGQYFLDKSHSLLQWSISHGGLSNYTVRFADYDASMMFDPIDISKSSVTITVNPASVSTLNTEDFSRLGRPYKSWDDQLANDPGFFNVRQFPTATFKSTKVEKSGPRNAKVTGNFTFLGVTKPVTFDVALVGQTERAFMSKLPAFGMRAEGKILPTDFGMKGILTDYPVTIVFDGEFVPKEALDDV